MERGLISWWAQKLVQCYLWSLCHRVDEPVCASNSVLLVMKRFLLSRTTLHSRWKSTLSFYQDTANPSRTEFTPKSTHYQGSQNNWLQVEVYLEFPGSRLEVICQGRVRSSLRAEFHHRVRSGLWTGLCLASLFCYERLTKTGPQRNWGQKTPESHRWLMDTAILKGCLVCDGLLEGPWPQVLTKKTKKKTKRQIWSIIDSADNTHRLRFMLTEHINALPNVIW